MGAKLPERTCFYTYDVNGNEIHESRKEFSVHKKKDISYETLLDNVYDTTDAI